MKKIICILTFASLTWLSSSCSDDDAPLPDDYTGINISADEVNRKIIGQWNRYTLTRTTYSNGQEVTQTLSDYQGDFRFDPPGTAWVNFFAHNFPSAGTFEVNLYGERLAFYQRATDQHINLILSEVSATKVVLAEYQMNQKDYFVVTYHTLVR